MHQESIDVGEMTIHGAWNSNICWLEAMISEITNISIPAE
jgi:hypothetical protein